MVATSPQRRALPAIVAKIREVDPRAGVVLQGSVDIDINWESFSTLRERFQHGAKDWDIFAHGEVVHDPAALARHCQELARLPLETSRHG